MDREPTMLLFAQRFSDHGQSIERWGVLAALKLEPFSARVVLPHERTLAAPKADRLNLIRACKTNLSPIFGMVDGTLGLSELAASAELIADFSDRAQIHNRLWRVVDPRDTTAIAERIAAQQVFIADGHHRYEISLAYRDERRRGEPEGNPLRNVDFVLAYLCSTRDPGLVVQPTHRLLAEPIALTPPASWREHCRITTFDDPGRLAATLAGRGKGSHPEPQGGRRIPRVGVVVRGSTESWLLEPADPAGRLSSLAPELRVLDVSFLHEVVFPGIAPERFSYTHDDADALGAVSSGTASVAVLLPPPSVDDVLAISRAGLTMPQKSTYFHPKVLTGLAFHSLEE
jgi:uncharacterized protein (DUF1015 family)